MGDAGWVTVEWLGFAVCVIVIIGLKVLLQHWVRMKQLEIGRLREERKLLEAQKGGADLDKRS